MAKRITQQVLDEIARELAQIERAIGSGLFGDKQWRTNPLDDDWDWVVASAEHARFVGWTPQEYRWVLQSMEADPDDYYFDVPKGLRTGLRDKIRQAGGDAGGCGCGFFAHVTLPTLKRMRTSLKRQLRDAQSRCEGQR